MAYVWRPINLNEDVRFKMTPYGEKIWQERHSGQQFSLKLPKKDGEWYIAQFWFVMTVLGPYMGLSGPDVMPMDVEVKESVKE